MAKKRKNPKMRASGSDYWSSSSPLGTIRTISGLEYVARPLLCE